MTALGAAVAFIVLINIASGGDSSLRLSQPCSLPVRSAPPG